MTLHGVVGILALIAFGLLRSAPAYANSPFDNVELDRLCDYYFETAGQLQATGSSGPPPTCSEMILHPPGMGWHSEHFANIDFNVQLSAFIVDYLELYDTPNEDLANYWISKSQSDFARNEFEEFLRRHSVNQNKIDEFHELLTRVNALKYDVQLVRHSTSYSDEERRKLVFSAEEQIMGLSASLTALLRQILGDSLSSSSLSSEFRQRLKEYAELRLSEHASVRSSEYALLNSMSLAGAKTLGEEFVDRCKECLELRDTARSERTKFEMEFSLWSDNPNPESLFKSERYRSYDNALSVLDDCVLKLFQGAFGNKRDTFFINSVFSFRAAYIHSKRRLNKEKRLLFVRTLIDQINGFPKGPEWEWRTANRAGDWRASNVVALTSVWRQLADNYSEHLIDKPVMLYFVPPPNAAGRIEPTFAGWLIGQWMTQSDIIKLTDQGRVATLDGTNYLLPPTFAFRTVNDAARLQHFKAVRIIEAQLE